MPLINNKINFCSQDRLLITSKLNNICFAHSNWGDDDLQAIRSTIRGFYRGQQKGVCAYCNTDVSLVSAGNAHVEHIVPKSIHVKFIFEPKNLCVICSDCNTIKRNQEVLNDIPNTLKRTKKPILYPRSSGAFRIVHPHFDTYGEHIKKKGRIYLDISPKGSFTIFVCRLNRYFHKFGVNDDFVDDDQLVSVMNNIMAAENTLQKVKLINDLRDMLFEV